jgi:hypothetical protein
MTAESEFERMLKEELARQGDKMEKQPMKDEVKHAPR